MLDVGLRQIVSKAAGTYFIVKDKSQVATIEADPKMRLFFLNEEKGAVNVLLKFAKGDLDGFKSVFGSGTRLKEKKGNCGIHTCLKALVAGPIAVINLRSFDNALDTTKVFGLNPNVDDEVSTTVGYKTIFNTDSFWIPSAKNIPALLASDAVLNFGNVGISDVSIFVTKAKDVTALTNEGELTLANCSMEIDEYPAIDFDMKVKDTFVDVYIFNNVFNPLTVGTNIYYGQYFDNNGNVDIANIEALSEIPASGFVKKVTGSMIPNLISDLDEAVSIDQVLNNQYINTGIICHINDDLFEADNKLLLDVFGKEFFNGTTSKVAGTSDYLLSHVVPSTLTTATATYPLTLAAENVVPTAANKITYGCVRVDSVSFEGSFEQGIRVGDKIQGTDDQIVYVTSTEILNDAAIIGVTTDTYIKVKYTCSGNIAFTNSNTKVTKLNIFTDTSMLAPFALTSYKPRAAQFTDGTATRQKDILDMMLNQGIVKGIKGSTEIAYLIDSFKSFVEAGYKYQYLQLCQTLNDANRFVDFIGQDIFITDLQKSTNPLFKVTPDGTFDYSYLPLGGNSTYSTKMLTKPTTGAMLGFFFGCGNIENGIVYPITGQISNLFYNKTNRFDIVANESGYIDGITELEVAFDDDDRKHLEAFKYNPVIFFNGGYTVFGNLSAQKTTSKQSQIQNVELLLYIKQNLYNLAKGEAFKGSNYEDYLRTETESLNFMNSLASAGAIEANPTVICNASNNTTDVANNKIKLVNVTYTPKNALEKVVFVLEIL